MKRAIGKSLPPKANTNALDKAELIGVLDDLIRTFEDTNRTIEELLAKVKE